MKPLICYPHGLGDCVLLTPALREFFFMTGNKCSVATLERFRSAKLFDNNPYIDEIFYTKDAWNDFENENIGFRSVYDTCIQIAQNSKNYTHVILPRHKSHQLKILSNFQDIGIINPVNPTAEIYTETYDVEMASKVISSCVGDNRFGFVQTTTGVPKKDLPEGYGRAWLKKNRGLEHVIEVGVDFDSFNFSINTQFEIMRRASAVCIPDSVFYHACGAIHKPVDFVYFSRGQQIYNAVRPIQNELQNIKFELDKL